METIREKGIKKEKNPGMLGELRCGEENLDQVLSTNLKIYTNITFIPKF